LVTGTPASSMSEILQGTVTGCRAWHMTVFKSGWIQHVWLLVASRSTDDICLIALIGRVSLTLPASFGCRSCTPRSGSRACTGPAPRPPARGTPGRTSAPGRHLRRPPGRYAWGSAREPRGRQSPRRARCHSRPPSPRMPSLMSRSFTVPDHSVTGPPSPFPPLCKSS